MCPHDIAGMTFIAAKSVILIGGVKTEKAVSSVEHLAMETAWMTPLEVAVCIICLCVINYVCSGTNIFVCGYGLLSSGFL
jgi:hypothetical protein